MQALLEAAGARLVSRAPPPPPPGAAGPPQSFVLYESRTAAGTAGGDQAQQAAAVRQEDWYRRTQRCGSLLVEKRWLTDSVACYTPKPLGPYLLLSG